MPEDKNDTPAQPQHLGSPAPEAPGDAACGCPGCPHQAEALPANGSGTVPDPVPPEAAEPAGEPVAEPSAEGAALAAPVPAPPAPRKPRPGWVCTAHCGKMSRIQQFSAPAETGFACGRKVIVRTDRGTEMATVVCPPQAADLAALNRELHPILRAATKEDLAQQKHIEEEVEPAELDECRRIVAEHKLPMKLVDMEHVFGGEKLTFYFMADGRIDFREMVRDAARKYRTRIEFRQIGVRDEARLLAEYEHCGQPLCCRQFLRGLDPVTMRMAKLQKATLDPTKISGRCGRLMCCLRFEDEAYAHLRASLPGRGAWVLTEELAGQVVSEEVLTQKVMVQTAEGRRVPVLVSDIKQVSDQPLPPPERKLNLVGPPPSPPPRPPAPRPPRPSGDRPPQALPGRAAGPEPLAAPQPGAAPATGGAGRDSGRAPRGGRSRRRGGRSRRGRGPDRRPPGGAPPPPSGGPGGAHPA